VIRFIQLAKILLDCALVHVVVKETHYIDTACMRMILLAGEWCLLNCYSIFLWLYLVWWLLV